MVEKMAENEVLLQSNEKELVDFLAKQYGIEVADDAGVRIGVLSDKKISLNREARGETERLFIIAHLFGHMVRLPDHDKYKPLFNKFKKEKILTFPNLAESEHFRESWIEYEMERWKIGKKLLETSLGVKRVEYLDEKFQIYIDTDLATTWEYLTKGEQTSNTDFNALLERRYLDGVGRYPNKLESIDLPDKIEFNKGVLAEVH